MKFRLILDKTREEEVVVTAHEQSKLTDQIEALVMRHEGIDRITAYTEDDMKVIHFQEIECITVENGKTFAIDIHGERFRLKQRLYELEEILPSSFIKINKSSLANQNRIERFKAQYSGAVDVIFKNGYVEYVSRRCFTEIKRRMDKK